MKICVLGIWHLGAVTSACLASLGHSVVGVDENKLVVSKLNEGFAPLFEPGLDDLLINGIESGLLSFTDNLSLALTHASVLWVALDTPVDDEDVADVAYVLNRIKSALKILEKNSVVIISSQLPVGSIQILEKFSAQHYPDKNFSFACVPENLRLGKAINVFLDPDRLIVGVRGAHAKSLLNEILTTITKKIEWMSVESAEMTKHAINAFLATSVTFANEIASICELVGADAKEVERGLKTEARIGPKAYLSPGGPFAGGTLARDIQFLGEIAISKSLPIPLLSSVQPSNDSHKNWVRRRLLDYFGNLENIVVAVWGLTYKAGTDTLRRSLAVELCDWLLGCGAIVQVSDPAVKSVPENWHSKVRKFNSPIDSLEGAQVLIVGTEWPNFREVLKNNSQDILRGILVIDPNRYIRDYVNLDAVKYLAVGTFDEKK